VKRAVQALAIDEHRGDFTPTFWTGAVSPNVSIEQVWFAGVHADIGGGYKTRSLADIPLVWMAKQAEAVGLTFDWTCLALARRSQQSDVFSFDSFNLAS
jgi:uncharacterized protein (DUF2235 family)